MITAFSILLAVMLDLWLGEPRRFHPLVGFGRVAQWIEMALYGDGSRERGLLALFLAVVPLVLSVWLFALWPQGELLLGVLLLYLAIGGNSLAQHGRAVATALAAGDLALARERVGWIVSRDATKLDEAGVARAAVESVLENGNDTLFGALFWFALFGAPGAVLYRVVNTLDAMWGYRNERYINFGWAAAKLDDLMNWVPARLTALAYALYGDTRRAWRCWRHQGGLSDSPNAGVVMASGGGALGLQLGGEAYYHGMLQEKPLLGEGVAPQVADIERAIQLVQRALLFWLGVVVFAGVVIWLI
jgi:adenosylcobinamide-phosphate synthase